MGLLERQELYGKLEAARSRPVIAYVTSNRPGSEGSIAGDAIGELLKQLVAIPEGAESLDLLLVSNGGDPIASCHIVALIREKVKRFSVLVPRGAYSAATLIALGADEIVMHPHGNLGPTDPQISAPRRQAKFGSEDLSAFLRFAREDVGLSDQVHLLRVFEKFCDEVGPVTIGVAARGAQLSVMMGEKLLQMHMKDPSDPQKAKAIAERLNRQYFHHGYALGRVEAREIGLKVASSDVNVENLIWSIWVDFEEELRIREPFNPIAVLRANDRCAPLFSDVPMANIPPDLPTPVLQQIISSIVQRIAVQAVPGASYEMLHAMFESNRCSTRCVTEGLIFATRGPDLQLRCNLVPCHAGWRTVNVSDLERSEANAKIKEVKDVGTIRSR